MLPIQRMISQYNHYKGNDIKYIVIHDTGNPSPTADALAHAKLFASGNKNASAHYFVDDHSIWQSVEDYNGSWAVGDGYNKYGINNQNCISIEICINQDNDFNKALIHTAELVRYLQKKYGIPNERVCTHYSASRKQCPRTLSANNWEPWNKYKAYIIGQSSNVPSVTPPTTAPTPTPTPGTKYLNLHPHMQTWAVYPMNSRPVSGNECGRLAPAQYGGLSYKIVEDRGDVKIINTGSFGTVQIYAPRDNDSSITDVAKYNNSTGNNTVTPPPSNKSYLNLNPHMETWAVYNMGVSPVKGYECGNLAPARYGGLSYEILEDRGDVKVINTGTFGRVQIYAPRDNDSTITNHPVY